MTTPHPAGWHDDPREPNAQRYWGGQYWTRHRRRKPVVQPPTEATPQQYAPPTELPPPAPSAPNVSHTTSGTDVVPKLRANKLAVHLIGGGFGGLGGALLAEVVVD